MARRDYSEFISDALRIKSEWSKREARYMDSKPVNCPNCNFTMIYAYEDVKGHINIKCPKCKVISRFYINFADL